MMKDKKKVIIKNSVFKTLRNNLRLVLYKSVTNYGIEYYEEFSIKEKNRIRLLREGKHIEAAQLRKQMGNEFKKQQNIDQAQDKSIIYCPNCRSIDSDMIYDKNKDTWYCLKCFEELHFNPTQIRLIFTKMQIETFLNKLAGPEACQMDEFGCRCGGKKFIYARQVLNSMQIPEKEQEEFLKLCRFFDGYCDCEILMNAAPQLLDHFS